MTVLHDEEFGPIKVRVSPLAKYVRLRINSDGTLAATLPKRAPMKLIERLLNDSRLKLRQALSTQQAEPLTALVSGNQIGKSHKLLINREGSSLSSSLKGLSLVVNVPETKQLNDRAVQKFIKTASLKALRKEAKAYLPRRVVFIAEKYGFANPKLRYTSGMTRWGSCSSKGDINLNINCMNLPFELIDYVIVHELCHTRHLNHSPEFWSLVGDCLPNYKQLRKELKQYNPIRNS